MPSFDIQDHADVPSLATLLSQVLVGFTIELDNETEHRMPHRTTVGGGSYGPWLVSLPMYANLLQFIDEGGVTVAELQKLARTEILLLRGMQRWGYITVAPDPDDARPKPPARDWLVRPTRKGLRAKEVWESVVGVIENRWESKFGESAIARLRESLAALVSKINMELPEYLPVLGYGLSTEAPRQYGPRAVEPPRHLTALLSKVLHAFTIEFERESEVSLAISANVVRLLNDEGVRVRDLPRLSGVSKEAIAMVVGFLQKRGYVTVDLDPAASRTKVVRMTAKGRAAHRKYQEALASIEKRWQERFGENAIRNLRESLEALTGGPTLEPYADNWRAAVPKPETMPYHPMVLHRGGYPDGS
jgi:DNA-binding MarR family transcriptional regulator